MNKYVRVAAPLVAMFLLGSVTTLFATAAPPECNWKFSEDRYVEHVGSDGAPSADAALKALPMLNHTIQIPAVALTNREGPDRAEKIGTDANGLTGYFVYLDGVARIQVNIQEADDGTHYVESFTTCLGV